MQRDGGAIGVVIVGDNHRAITGRYRPLAHEIAHCGGQHDPRNVITGERQGSLDGTRRGDDPRSAQPPQALTRATIARCMIGHTLAEQDIAVVMHPGCLTAQAHRDIGHRHERIHGGVDPNIGYLAVNHIAIHTGATAPDRGLFHKPYPRARTARNQSRLKARDTTARDQQVTIAISLFITVSITILGRLPQTRRFTDDRLEHVFPRCARMDEGFVVKACRQKAAGVVVQHTHVMFKAWPMVLAARLQPVKKLGRGGALVRLQPGTAAKVDEGIGFFGPRGHDPARAVIFEAAANQHLVIGQKRRGQCVALISAQAFAVKGKLDRHIAVDHPAVAGQTGAHLKPFQSGRLALILSMIATGGSVDWAGYVPNTSSVAVQRAAKNHLPQP